MSTQRNTPAGPGTGEVDRGLVIALPVLFLLSALAGLLVQSRSTIPPWIDGSPIEFFTATPLWMLSAVCLLIASRELGIPWRAVFWLLSCLFWAFSATDEIYVIHEHSSDYGINDDVLKIGAYAVIGVVLFLICRVYKPARPVVATFVVGYAFQTIYMIEELGDGDVYRLPFNLKTMRRWEEFFELVTAWGYLVGCTLLYTVLARRAAPAPGGRESVP